MWRNAIQPWLVRTALLTCVVFTVAFPAPVAPTTAHAAAHAVTSPGDGDFDPSFGVAGQTRTDFALSSGAAGTALITLPDGKLLVGGSTLNGIAVDDSNATGVLHGVGYPDSFVLARYNADGSLDSGFGVAGEARARFVGRGAVANAMALQPDGKIVIAGNAGQLLALARFTANGALDPTFGDGGLVTTVSDGVSQTIAAIAVQPDGKIIAAANQSGGRCSIQVGTDTIYQHILTLRYMPDGTLDNGFGNSGEVVRETDKLQSASAVSVAPDGDILIAGSLAPDAFCYDAAKYYSFVTRLSPSGAVITSFGVNGTALAPLDQSSSANTMLVDSGKIWLGGGSNGAFALARFNLDGSVDNSFGISGTVTTDFAAGDEQIEALALQSDGKLLAAGPVNGSDLDFGVARYTASGVLDTTFAQGGKAAADFAGGHDFNSGITVDGARVVTAGSSGRTFALAAFNLGGALDPSFGVGGKTQTTFASTDSVDYAPVVAVQPDNKIVAAGFVVSDTNRLALVRYNSDGSLDQSFGAGGKALTAPGEVGSVEALVIDAHSRILLAGNIDDTFTIRRFLSDGKVDQSFGQGGMATKPRDTPNGAEEVHSLIVLYSGQILASGSATDGSAIIARFQDSGSLDSGFGSGGVITAPTLGKGYHRMVRQPDGKLIVTGSGDYDQIIVGRFNPDGSVDKDFGVAGFASIIPDNSPQQQSKFIALQPDGGIIIGASVLHGIYLCSQAQPVQINRPEPCSGYVGAFSIVRFHANGTLDTSFNINPYPTQESWPSLDGMVTQADGKIIALTGAFDTTNGNSRIYAVRYNVDSSLDTTFNGRQISFGMGAAGIAFQPNSKLVLTTPTNGEGAAGDFLISRLYNRPSFSDVQPGDYFYAAVITLAARQVLSGYSDNSFRPGANTTRGQLAKIVTLAYGDALVNPATPTFADVPRDNTFYSYIETAAALGLIDGYRATAGSRTFHPGDNVTRGQLTKIVVRAAGWPLLAPTMPTFNDVIPSDAFYSFIETAVQHGVISGYTADAQREFRPGNSATRGQVAKIVYLALGSPTANRAKK